MNMKHLYTSLDSGVTSGSVTDNSITDDSVIEIYFDNTDCYIDSTSQSGHTVYFKVGGNATGTNVCVVVNNLTNFTPYDDTNIVNRVISLESEVETLDNVVTTLETDVETLETRVDGLNASNINYDEHSTLYYAMGDIELLETTSKNLVGAINEVKGSGGSSQEVYDDTERVIGTWFDKPLYKKTFSTSQVILSVNTWVSSGIPQGDIKLIIEGRTTNSAGALLLLNYGLSNGNIVLNSPRALTLEANTKMTLYYTKVGD